MRKGVVIVAIVAAAVSLASCGREDDGNGAMTEKAGGDSVAREAVAVETGSTRSAVALCDATRFRVAFAQRDRVSVTSDGRELATASYTDRGIDGSCDRIRAPRSWNDRALNEGVYRDIELECGLDTALALEVHPIEDGDTGGIAGSTLVAFTRSAGKAEVVVAAVLKNREHAEVASRIYYAPQHCRPV